MRSRPCHGANTLNASAEDERSDCILPGFPFSPSSEPPLGSLDTLLRALSPRNLITLLLAGAFWNPMAPKLFEPADMLAPDFRIKVIADITCDINGSVPSTKRATSIADPLYDYDPKSDSLHPPLSNPAFITVMAIDNLPCELPRSASEEFGRDLIDRILRPLLIEDPEGVIARGTIAEKGQLTSHFEYLRDYVSE